jgi:hypothetical protein
MAMKLYKVALTVLCRCGFSINGQEVEFVRKIYGDVIGEEAFPTLPPAFINGKERAIAEVGTWMFDSRLHYIHCPKCSLVLDCCPHCNAFTDGEFIDPEGSGTIANQRCALCKKPFV